MQIGFIGLGHMGFPMAAQILKHQFDIYAYDPIAVAMDNFREIGGKAYENTLEIAKNSDIIITMIPAEKHLFDIYSATFIQHLRPHVLCIDCSTVGPIASRKWHELLKQANIHSLDAPVSGGVAAATHGSLTFMVGGDIQDVDKARPVFTAMGSNIIHTGENGTGQAAKICNNLILANTMVAVSEGFKLAKAFALPFDKLHEITHNSSAQSWVIDKYVPVPGILESVPANQDYKAGFSCQMMFKDLTIIDKACQELGLPLALTQKSLEIYHNIILHAEGEKDFSYVYAFDNNNT
jgi:3-hydroxyisobutyrate dehydrogenase